VLVADLDSAVSDYVDLLRELTDIEMKYFDFMAVLSSVLFLSDLQIEAKIDVIFSYIALGKLTDFHRAFSSDDFLVALGSFETGLSHAMGKKASSEAFVKDLAKSWGGLMTVPILKVGSSSPGRSSTTQVPSDEIEYQRFFELCTNRQQQVRRLLDIISSAQFAEVDSAQRNEAVYSDKAQDKLVPTGGDEWLANPAWKKTAEKMIPSPLVENKSIPAASLSLEWVHGYRAYDCHNNLRYADSSANNIVFPTAALAVVQGIHQELCGNQTQAYFGEHTDDVLCLAVFRVSATCSMVASGEIGKTPAIHLYRWDADSINIDAPGKFTVSFLILMSRISPIYNLVLFSVLGMHEGLSYKRCGSTLFFF